MGARIPDHDADRQHETGLLTTKTEGNPPLDEGMSIYDIFADRAERMGDEPLYTYKDDSGKWVTKHSERDARRHPQPSPRACCTTG